VLTVELDTATESNHILYSIRTRRVTNVPVTRVNTMASVLMYSRLTLSTHAIVLYAIPESSVKVSSVYLSRFFNVSFLELLFLVKTKLKCFLYNPGSNSAFYIGSKVTTIAANTTNIVFDAPVTTTVSSPYNINSKTVTSVPRQRRLLVPTGRWRARQYTDRILDLTVCRTP
jgi:hypothetical protein